MFVCQIQPKNEKEKIDKKINNLSMLDINVSNDTLPFYLLIFETTNK